MMSDCGLNFATRFCMTLLLLISASSSICSAQAPGDGVKVFSDSIVPLPEHAPFAALALSEEAKRQQLPIHFSLETRNQAEKEARILKGEIISAAEMRTRYSASEADFSRLVGWLRSKDFRIIRTTPDFANVYASASVAQIEKTLGVRMVPVTSNGITTPNAETPPQLPAAIGNHVKAILGLQPYVQAIKHSTPSPHSDAEPYGAAASPSSSMTSPFMIHDVLVAYDADSLGSTGKGQVIAILIDTLPLMDDLTTFWQKNSVATKAAQVKLIDVRNGGAPLSAPQGEESLDTEWASGIAPGATIRVYASGSLQYLYLDEALDQIYEDAQNIPGLRQVSISLGLREDLVSKGERDSQHVKFSNLAALGVTVFVSSGDAGSNPDRSGKARSPDSQVEYEASDPFTVAVGGTSLKFDSSTGKVVSEVAWINSGGGISKAFDRPSWQDGYKSILLSNRGVPDVSSVADPNPGAFVWLNGKSSPRGGTSWSAPVWAGFCALLADAKARQGKHQLGFLAPLLYHLPTTSSSFRDIRVGSNGAYQAGMGWDAVTGLGVPNLKAIFEALPK